MTLIPSILKIYILSALILSSISLQPLYSAAAETADILNLNTGTKHERSDHECALFVTTGPTSSYFTHHRFYDFRSLLPVAGTFNGGDITSAIPAIISSPNISVNEDVTNEYFRSQVWTPNWEIQAWSRNLTPMTLNTDANTDPGVLASMVMSSNNVYIEIDEESQNEKTEKEQNAITVRNTIRDSKENYSTHLTLRTARLETFQTAAEIDSTLKDYQFLSVRFEALVKGPVGACAGMFTYHALPASFSNNSTLDSNTTTAAATVQESDIEILTSDPSSSIHFTNQPSQDASGHAIPGATTNTTITSSSGGKRKTKNAASFDRSKWNIYRMDWTADQTAWYVNGISVANISINVPRDPMGLVVNMWSDGGGWSGEMEVGEAAFLQVKWIEVVFNVSDGSSSGYDAGNDEVRPDGLLKRDGGDEAVCIIGDGVRSSGVARAGRMDKWVVIVSVGTLLTAACF
ncbi:concanavalin A-like lectin/glucanase domain-containing protein [Xylogone sp. PMI_703]|nr:concanavalin A-like lectin/glucanase domain-containing protein [Xylogone sp. PMI_703]